MGKTRKRGKKFNLKLLRVKARDMNERIYDFMLLDTSSTNVNVLEPPERASGGSIIASMVPDEVILQHSNYSARRYEAALMFVDVTGFTDLCERYYTKDDNGGPSRLTQVLNSYIGAMVQEILTHGGDVLNFSGDAMLAMWKKSTRLAMQSVVHSAIDCGLSVQKNYGTYHTDVGVVLKVKVAISAGVSHFTLIGDATHSHYVILGQPVWDVKIAEYVASAGDVMTAASAWTYANQAEYITEPFGDGRHTKVLKTGVSWKRVGLAFHLDKEQISPFFDPATGETENYYREFSLRPVIVSALRSLWWPSLRKFMVKPVIWAVENDEPMEFLTEIRRVVIVFLNVITKDVTDELLLEIVDTAYKCVYSISSASNGLLNKVSMFDKDLMFLIVFGLRGMTHEDEAQKSLLCAQALQESLVDPNITSVSIGVSSGTTYCGVVGHVLRREYTVIGSAVNKAARLMMTYPDKLTCDKETFLKSKMKQQHFRLLAFKPMKGIKNPGPVYEFNKYGWPESPSVRRHPILGRDGELRMFILTLQNAIKHQHQAVISNQDHVYGVVFVGPTSVGKKRLMDECIYLTPKCVQVARFALLQTDKISYGLFRQIALKVLTDGPAEHGTLENIIRNSVNFNELTLVQIHAMNTFFGCHFALPDDFGFIGNILDEHNVKNIVRAIFKNNISYLWIVAIDKAMHADDESWRLLLILLDTKTIFVIMTIINHVAQSDVVRLCLSNNMLLKIPVSGLDHWYHSALACQFLDVQAIPADLEKLIQSASNGIPTWIQNFIISLVQKGDLSIKSVLKTKALEDGNVVPPASSLHITVDSTPEYHHKMPVDEYFEQVLESLSCGETDKNKIDQRIEANDFIQVAVLADTYEVLNVNMSMDADVILKTYDSLTPFEKILLKCGSVLGIVFSRRMMQYLLQCNSPRKIAEAVANLFSIRVLECEGGDFTKKTSKVLIHASPDLQDTKPPYCSCLGVKRLADSRDLPSYAFCGYMRFKHPLFRTTTYEMLTETKKREMHARALLYLEHYTRRCWYCGSGCFHKMMGIRAKDGLVSESAELKKTQQMIEEFSSEANNIAEERSQSRSVVDFKGRATESSMMRSHLIIRESPSSETNNDTAERSRFKSIGGFKSLSSFLPEMLGSENSLLFSERMRRESTNAHHEDRVRSFSSVDLVNCECLAIAMFVYCQIIDHCRGAGEQQKLFEAYLEYADLCVMNSNTPQALRLLNEAEAFVLSSQWHKVLYKVGWLRDFYLGRILSLRGACMLESGELFEARKHLYRAMQLFRDPFPTNKYRQMIRRMQFSMHRRAVKLAPRGHVGTQAGLVGCFYEVVAVTLNRLFKLFSECKEYSNAELTAKWSLDYARRSNVNFQLLCESYGNMISINCYNQEFSQCVELETLAMELCHRKRGMLDDAETRAVCILYTSIFIFYVEYGNKSKSLEFGLPLMNMVSMLPGPEARDRVVIWLLKLMLSDLRISEMVLLMKESLCLDDHLDMSSTTWYYFYAMVILIETGYCVESYQSCERFYTKNGDVLLRSKGKDAAWDYFACMWLITVRVGAWERSVLWEDKVNEIISMEKTQIENKLYLQLILLEGFLIMLSREIETSNSNKITTLQKTAKNLFKVLRRCCQKAPIYLPRYYLLLAYFSYLKGLKLPAHIYLGKTLNLAKDLGEGTIIIWAEHTRQHWTGTLDPALEDYWTEHAEPDNLLDYRNFSEYKLIVPFTLPLPKTLK